MVGLDMAVVVLLRGKRKAEVEVKSCIFTNITHELSVYLFDSSGFKIK